MSSRLPDFVDPWRMADLGRSFSGKVAIAELPRLAKAVLESQGEAELELAFDRDGQKRARLQGFVKATLALQCQRCLGPMRVPLESELSLVLVESMDEAERLPEHYDPLLLEEPRIRLLDIVEDELLLSMPQVPRHNPGECGSGQRYESEPDLAEQEESTENDSPFAVLAELKHK